MLNISNQIIHHLKQLHMPTMRGCYEQIADQARNQIIGANNWTIGTGSLLTMSNE